MHRGHTMLWVLSSAKIILNSEFQNFVGGIIQTGHGLE